MPSSRPLDVHVSDPTFGPSFDPRDVHVPAVRVDVEPGGWVPRDPPTGDAPELVFVDGVQQVEAWLNITPDSDVPPVFGVAFAVAAGAVVAGPDGAQIATIQVERAIATEGTRCLHLPPVNGFSWHVRTATQSDPNAMAMRVASFRRDLEQTIAEQMADDHRLVVLDGRLSFLRETRHPVIGAVKSHHAMYLDAENAAIVSQLRSGQRTPLFAIGDELFGWYQRLPNVAEQGWNGVLRGEVSQGFGLATARHLADLAAAHLPRYAGRPHRDPRAPQNLMPIGALESRLRHRLGDRRLALRAVRVASASATLDAPAEVSSALRRVA